jgi:predicted acetyltransferase
MPSPYSPLPMQKTLTSTRRLESVTPETLPEVGLIVARAFGSTVEGGCEWVEKKIRLAHARQLKREGVVAACAMRIPMGQYFGGKSVPMVGVAGVGVLPQYRGEGVARELMSTLLCEMYDEGTPISSLFPATTELYRKVGYEQAGSYFEHSYPVSRIHARKGVHLRVRSFDSARDDAAVRMLHTNFAQHHDGMLDRNEYIWQRVFSPRQGESLGYVAQGEDGVEGYIFFRQEAHPSGRHDIAVTDMVASTPAAARAIINFIAGLGSMAMDIKVSAANMHPLLTLLDEPRYLNITFKDYWMLRIVRVKEALEYRGYPLGLTSSLTFHVTDPLLEDNTGLYRLAIADGVGHAERISPGSELDKSDNITTDINGLAQLYSGQFTAAHLAAVGRIQCNNPATLAKAKAVFGGYGGCCDFF